MWNNFFKHIDIDPKNVHILDGNAADLIHECNEYEKAIAAVGGVELFVGGIGPDGHIAFNEPGSSSCCFSLDNKPLLLVLIFPSRIEFSLTHARKNARTRHYRCQRSVLR